ncbi:MAG: pyruvate dehydrogenase (acetyl-transferring) E1 component subunit alpha [Gammaproteobacteria bacterium]|nr:pyruvate dehydrogenase (acetyl-transferring) E1 component subunit alpha [Gammaproteobacteria bacterium]
MSVVAKFEIHHRRYLDERGEPVGELPEFTCKPETVIELYRGMVLTRAFDEKAVALQRTGKLGTYASTLGQEAAAVGLGRAMQEHDVLLPTYRECGVQLMRGVRMLELFLYWGGDERGMDFAVPRRDFPVSIVVASHIVHAVGVAFAMQYRNQARAAVPVFGDGATSKGDFYEALNAAGVWKLPVVFMGINNGWAISVPRTAQTACETLAQKAIAAGIHGEQVDGNDAIAVYQVCREALERAYRGEGATLIEALTYRLGDHTTADDATRYRAADDVEHYRSVEPLARLKAYLINAGAWSDDEDRELHEQIRAEVENAAHAYLDSAPPTPQVMFDYLYESLPPVYADQRSSVGQDDDADG